MIAALALALLAGSPTVSPAEFAHVQVGDTRPHVQAVFDTTGVRAGKWADEEGGLTLTKLYPAEGGGVVEIVYFRVVGHRWHLTEKAER